MSARRLRLPGPLDEPVVRAMLPILAASAAIGVLVSAIVERSAAPRDVARRLLESGNAAAAERRAWALVLATPGDAGLFVDFLDTRAPGGDARSEVPGEEIARFLARPDLPPATAAIDRLVYAASRGEDDPGAVAPVQALAGASPPARWANHVLGRLAAAGHRMGEAASYYEKEGLAFPERTTDLATAIAIWANAGAWSEIDRRIDDPRYAAIVSPLLRLERAIAHRDWRGILVNHMRAWLDRGDAPALGLAGLAAALWLWFTGRLGRLGERPRAIRAAAIVAFFLGVVSSNVTLVLVIVEDKILGFTENGNPAVDLAYFVIGVGLREEVSKLLLFLPLVPILRRRGNRLDTLAIAAIVGLGFAADENLGYLEHGIGTTALARFLTANFAHMAMTGLVGISLYDALERRRPPETFSQTLALIVVLHGAYDFLLSNALVADVSFLSMTIFIILTRMFLSDVASVRRSDAGSPLLTAFGRAVACVTGASFVYAAALVGPLHAAQILALGLLGEAIMIYMFTLEFGKL